METIGVPTLLYLTYFYLHRDYFRVPFAIRLRLRVTQFQMVMLRVSFSIFVFITIVL